VKKYLKDDEKISFLSCFFGKTKRCL